MITAKIQKVTEFLNLTFEYGLVPVINKPTRVMKTSATAIDHIITNSLLHRSIDTRIINDTHREKLYFIQFSTRMATWAAFDLFPMFT